jgi:DNA invertase Pin-like site-specific DNA recombinase
MRVAVYARVSTKDKGQSTDNQMPDLRRYAQVHGWDIYKEYAEKESGSTANRTEFKKLFADAHQRKFDLVLFWSLDRFSREGALQTLQHLNTLEIRRGLQVLHGAVLGQHRHFQGCRDFHSRYRGQAGARAPKRAYQGRP